MVKIREYKSGVLRSDWLMDSVLWRLYSLTDLFFRKQNTWNLGLYQHVDGSKFYNGQNRKTLVRALGQVIHLSLYKWC